jgi:hypothetical protein
MGCGSRRERKRTEKKRKGGREIGSANKDEYLVCGPEAKIK